MDEFWKDNIEGIKHIHIADFLLMERWLWFIRIYRSSFPVDIVDEIIEFGCKKLCFHFIEGLISCNIH
jgi:hypothetical protein